MTPIRLRPIQARRKGSAAKSIRSTHLRAFHYLSRRSSSILSFAMARLRLAANFISEAVAKILLVFLLAEVFEGKDCDRFVAERWQAVQGELQRDNGDDQEGVRSFSGGVQLGVLRWVNRRRLSGLAEEK
jgi:hypothetical protein